MKTIYKPKKCNKKKDKNNYEKTDKNKSTNKETKNIKSEPVLTWLWDWGFD